MWYLFVVLITVNAAEQIAGPSIQATASFASSSAGQAVIAIVTIVNVTIMIGLAGYCYRKDRKRRAKQKKNRYILKLIFKWKDPLKLQAKLKLLSAHGDCKVTEEWGT